MGARIRQIAMSVAAFSLGAGLAVCVAPHDLFLWVATAGVLGLFCHAFFVVNGGTMCGPFAGVGFSTTKGHSRDKGRTRSGVRSDKPAGEPATTTKRGGETMFQGLDHIGKAANLLAARNAMLNQRLFEAAKEIEAAIETSDEWPSDLQEKARKIEDKLTAKGPIDATVNGMDVVTATAAAQEIFDLSVDALAAKVQMQQRAHAIRRPRSSRRPARNKLAAGRSAP